MVTCDLPKLPEEVGSCDEVCGFPLMAVVCEYSLRSSGYYSHMDRLRLLNPGHARKVAELSNA